MRGAVRENEAVHAELTIVWRIAKITAISPKRGAVFIGFAQRLIHPVPDKTALQARVVAKSLPVFRKTAEAVAHRMCIFAKDQWTRLIR